MATVRKTALLAGKAWCPSSNGVNKGKHPPPPEEHSEICSRCPLVPRPERFIWRADRTKIEPPSDLSHLYGNGSERRSPLIKYQFRSSFW